MLPFLKPIPWHCRRVKDCAPTPPFISVTDFIKTRTFTMEIKFYNILETKSKSKNLGDVQIVKMSGGGTNRWNTDLVPH